MPAEGIHLTSLREAGLRLGISARRCLVQEEDAARLGAVLHDLPYFDHYLEAVLRYAAKVPPRSSRWGDVVHERAAVPIVFAVLRAARRARSTRLAAVALGLASHAAIDRQLHPLINALARRHADGSTHDAAHREVEKFQSICFHEAYYGADRMGTAAIGRVVQVPMRELFADPLVASAITAAFEESMSAPPSLDVLRQMGRGYEQHTAVIGSPLGLLVAPASEKERARPKFLFGAWGTFAQALERAIEASVEVLERAWAAYEAPDAEADVEGLLGSILPPGTIDAPGDDTLLDAHFTPRLA